MTFLWSPPALRHATINSGAFNPAQLASVIGAVLDPGSASTVVTGSGIASLADSFGGSPAVQATDNARPPRTTASNSVTVLQGVNDRMTWPASAANNQLVTWWWGAHVLLDDVAASKFLWRYGPTASFDPAATDSHNLRVLSNESLLLQVFTTAAGTAARSATTAPSVLNNTAYVFLTVEMNLALVGEANQVVISADGVVLPLAFADSIGAPGAMPAALQGNPGGSDIVLLASLSSGSFSPFIGKMGRQYFGKAAETGATQGCLTAATRTNLALFDRPVV